ncbi:hypothetical protein [Flavivirga eckloniae]|uniref:Lipoprotein n=1 Tax=Flavivirga eckloniae TaxID=1803846 RepID=A0A2K9PUI7_9FLAO|nr:hypothetical protein [Flavivirga eckloniae]AUP80731.1 hypothetical protein C1H87_19230 [Flavivirga eckloniae]
MRNTCLRTLNVLVLLRIVVCVLVLSAYGCQFANKQETAKIVEASQREPSSKIPFWRSPENGVDILPNMNITDSVISRKPWKHIKMSMSKITLKDSKRYINNDNCRYYKSLEANFRGECVVNDQYAIVSTPGEFGNVISIFPAFDGSLDKVTMDFNDVLYTLTDSNFDDFAFFQGLYDNYLFVDTGTSSGSRGLFVVNLDLGKIVFGTYTNKVASYDGKKLTYWGDTDKKAKDFCPNMEHTEHYLVAEQIEYDLASLKGEKTGKFECYFAE